MTAEERKIRKAIQKAYKGVRSIRHVYPRAYCVGKPALYSAVFAIPPMDAESQVREIRYALKEESFASVNNDSARDVNSGDWCSLAYISTANSGATHVVPGTINRKLK